MLVEGLAPRLPPPLRGGTRSAPSRDAERQFRFAGRGLGLRSVFLEIAVGDCAVARCAAGHVERAYAAGALEAHGGERAPNLVPVASDGILLPVPEASVDAALSSHVIERLRPSDVLEHLQSVHRALRRGGRYLCITTHRYCGKPAAQARSPYLFSAEGLRELLAEAGYRRIRFYARVGARYAEVPYWMLLAAEALLGQLPSGMRRWLAGGAAARALLGLRAEAVK